MHTISKDTLIESKLNQVTCSSVGSITVDAVELSESEPYVVSPILFEPADL